MKLVTHDGNFHYDEILATAVLLKIYPDAEVIRTRVREVINTGDIVYDVGQTYDPSKYRYDHHQNTFHDTYSPQYNIRLSSAGLIFKHFHDKLFERYGFTRQSTIFEEIVEKVYFEFFLPADAIDNGYDSVFGAIRARTVADVVKNFNVYSENTMTRDENLRFETALDFVSMDLDNYLKYVLCEYALSYEHFYNVLKDFAGDIFVTDKKVATDLLYELNEKLQKNIKFIIVKNDNDFRIITIPVERGKFAIKYPLHPKWRGLSGTNLDEVSGINGCVFVHASGFTGGNSTLEGAVEMCRKSLEWFERCL
ncbi:uncharacterized protein VICG_00508 [Vittaforma corneae ATCC 50505]|uniref:Metal-dependent protein hydrolase n=1 Tax=Vittaforma corneae (strain ATCC 50505) TaxID=993615 RepID=L2GP49_VITCO|nr:uncharacterized protein VICG_00508 [Vittaforma corneae ATCC 50505]ELA42409.1 hypothetical protein VICG_00508 [Vittaforma corneae ATCC 50505]